jgi:hypothetical protein
MSSCAVPDPLDSRRKVEGQKQTAASIFTALLRAEVFEEALLGMHRFSDSEISAQARVAAASMLVLLNSRCL